MSAFGFQSSYARGYVWTIMNLGGGRFNSRQIAIVDLLCKELHAWAQGGNLSLSGAFRFVYPFIGGNAIAHSVNLVGADTCRITWSGTVTHDANGITGNGSSGQGATGAVLSVNANVACGVYSRTNNQVNGYELANANWIPAGTGIACRWTSSLPTGGLQYISQGAVAQLGGGTGAQNMTLNAPAAYTTDDVWFAIFHNPYGSAPTLSGWTSIASNAGMTIFYYRYAGSLPNMTASFTAAGGASGVVMCYRGVNTITFVQNNSGTNNAFPTVIGNTVNQSGYVIVLAGAGANSGSGALSIGGAYSSPWSGLHESNNSTGTTWIGCSLGVYHSAYSGTASTALQRTLTGAGIGTALWKTSWLYMTPSGPLLAEETYFSSGAATSIGVDPVYVTGVASTDSSGLFSNVRTDTATLRGYRNGTQLGSTASTNINSFNTNSFYLLSTGAGSNSNRNLAFAYLTLPGPSVMLQDQATLYSAVQNFQSRMGRAV